MQKSFCLCDGGNSFGIGTKKKLSECHGNISIVHHISFTMQKYKIKNLNKSKPIGPWQNDITKANKLLYHDCHNHHINIFFVE